MLKYLEIFIGVFGVLKKLADILGLKRNRDTKVVPKAEEEKPAETEESQAVTPQDIQKELERTNAERLDIIRRKYAGTMTKEDERRFEELNARMAELCPSVTADDGKFLQEIKDGLKELDREAEEEG